MLITLKKIKFLFLKKERNRIHDGNDEEYRQ